MELRIKNPFADIKTVNLSEKELEYITAIVAGVQAGKAMKAIHVTPLELSKIYLKFGLTDKTRLREVQIGSITGMNNFINKELFFKVAKKYGFTECFKFAENVQLL